MKLKINKDSWDVCQMKNTKGECVAVSQLSEDEAKQSLCDLVDLVEDLQSQISQLDKLIEAWRDS